ncbi:uncharacterized protein BCR38DRAFT_486899 [Pseudomassariella vexata]|uniref:Molybdate-anion transporter n=1 Tax=Pseudomassariella vexata TaxID=1141098 RepID=A0A1Y2DTR1_9PEZI|nr:uncharacterized protein BCR38DRAFT_486899 [Pseudomassariella vexata]ORY62637.1 hypothetical protein BCR38DRAFT_486899 [Pseudomassariella vexata]
MDPYQTNFAALGALCALLLACQPTRMEKSKPESGSPKRAKPKTFKNPQADYYYVYALVMGADWLQGPYLYSLYKDEHGVSSSVVFALFTTGFLSGGLSAYFVGSLADKYGRKKTCLAFCLLNSASCLLTMVPMVPLLFAGRVLGGISTSILFSVFDSWLVSNFRERRLVEKGCDLSQTYGTMSTINSVTAIASGVMSDVVVWMTGTKKAPFLVSAILLWLATPTIKSRWAENYGSAATKGKKNNETTSMWSIIKRPVIMALALAMTMFEGSMYLFVFFWVPALKSVQQSAGELPYGFIFASFMASVMAASLAFNLVMQRRLMRYSRLLVLLLVVANFVFVKLSSPKTEQSTFWFFCLFEACVGLYFPCIGYLKGRMIEDGIRAKVYSLMRVPLNIFVVVSLIFARESGDFGRVFSVCSMFLTAAFGAVWAVTLNEDIP